MEDRKCSMSSPSAVPAAPAASAWLSLGGLSSGGISLGGPSFVGVSGAGRSSGALMTDAGSPLATALDLDHPRRGITVEQSGSTVHSLLGLDLGSHFHLADSWVRGDDVTAVYETSDSRRLRTTAMWRVRHGSGSQRAWELITSTQTSLLHSDPEVAVVCDIAAAELPSGSSIWGSLQGEHVHWHHGVPQDPVCVLVNCDGAVAPEGLSILVATHPDEARRMQLHGEDTRIVVECRLFSNALEKGVLLRSRVLAAIGPSANAREWSTTLVRAFAASAPILTT